MNEYHIYTVRLAVCVNSAGHSVCAHRINLYLWSTCQSCKPVFSGPGLPSFPSLSLLQYVGLKPIVAMPGVPKGYVVSPGSCKTTREEQGGPKEALIRRACHTLTTPMPPLRPTMVPLHPAQHPAGKLLVGSSTIPPLQVCTVSCRRLAGICKHCNASVFKIMLKHVNGRP